MMERFGFTERQAQYIIDMRLGRLTGIEREKVQTEYAEKQKEIAYYQSILGDETILMGVIKDELLQTKAKYSDERRTRIVSYEGEIDIEDLIHEQEVAITLTNVGYIKRTAADTYKAQRRGGKGIMGLSTREEDNVKNLLITSSHSKILFITNFGRVYSLKGYEIPDAGRTAKGIAIVNLLQLQAEEKVATMIPITDFDDSKYLIIATKSGIIKKTELSAYSNMRKGGLIAVDLRDGDELINAHLLNDDEDIMMATRKGMSIRFNEKDVRSTGRDSIGVKGITLREGDYVIGMDVCKPGDSILIVTEKGFGKRTDVDEYRAQTRGGKGLLTYKISEKTGELVGMMMVNDDNDIMMITSEGVIIRIHAEDINKIGRNTSGVRLMRTTDSNLIVSCAKTDKEDEAVVPVETENNEIAEAGDISEIGTVENIDNFESEDKEENGPDLEAGKDILDKLGID